MLLTSGGMLNAMGNDLLLMDIDTYGATESQVFFRVGKFLDQEKENQASGHDDNDYEKLRDGELLGVASALGKIGVLFKGENGVQGAALTASQFGAQESSQDAAFLKPVFEWPKFFVLPLNKGQGVKAISFSERDGFDNKQFITLTLDDGAVQQWALEDDGDNKFSAILLWSPDIEG